MVVLGLPILMEKLQRRAFVHTFKFKPKAGRRPIIIAPGHFPGAACIYFQFCDYSVPILLICKVEIVQGAHLWLTRTFQRPPLLQMVGHGETVENCVDGLVYDKLMVYGITQ